MKLSEAVKMSNAIYSISDKNKIAISEVRLAVVNNLIALMPHVEIYEKKVKMLNEQFSSEDLKQAEQEFAQVRSDYEKEKDEAKKKELFDKVQILYVRVQNLKAPFNSEYNKAMEKISDEVFELKLDKVKVEDFDKATDKLELPVSALADLRFMFINKDKK